MDATRGWVGRPVRMPDGGRGVVVAVRGGMVEILLDDGSTEHVPARELAESGGGELVLAARAPARPAPAAAVEAPYAASPQDAPPAARRPRRRGGLRAITDDVRERLRRRSTGAPAPGTTGSPPPRETGATPEEARGLTLDGGPPAAGAGGHLPRALSARLPGLVATGTEFAVEVSVIQSARPAAIGGLAALAVPAEGATVTLVLDAPGLVEVEDRLTREVRVPPSGDSGAVVFRLRGDRPGPYPVHVRALHGGTYLGELSLEVALEHDATTGPQTRHTSPVEDVDDAGGELTLFITFDPVQQRYRFQFVGDVVPEEVVSSALLQDPRAAVERLVRQLDAFAAASPGYSAAQTRDYLMQAGVQLWSTLLPEALREQFWDLRAHVSQLTIFTAADVVPWELLFPLDRGRTPAGFLVEQFPVVRWLRDRRPAARSSLGDVRFVLPPGSPPQAAAEIDAVAAVLGRPATAPVTTLDELTALVNAGGFDALHFACHNAFAADGGSSIHLDADFAPVQLSVAGVQRTLEATAPVVFMNACRTAGQSPGWTSLTGWAQAFLGAGAGAFIGSSWAVRDSSARTFAEQLYAGLGSGRTLGESVTAARRAIADAPGDSSWLAYTVYGNPRLTAVAR